MKEGSEGDGGGSSDDIPTSRDADSTVSNGHRTVPGGLSLGGTTLANALLGLTMDRVPSNGGTTGNGSNNSNSMPHVDALFGIHSTSKGGAGTKLGGVDANGRDKQFVCNICHRSFGYKHVLQNHERTHTGEKPFECKECHKRFTRDHHLKTHMRLHTGEKPYHCSHCERQFVQVANLRRHLRVHTGERPYSCKICPSRFSDSNQLKAHLLIHEGKKPFECPKCGGHFRRRHHLVHHKCPNDEANIGKPRRGRRPKAYEELPTLLSPVLQERLSTPVSDLHPPPPPPMTVGLTSVITRGPSPNNTLVPQPAHMPHPSRRSVHHPMHHPLLALGGGSNGCYHPEQSGPLDMTVSSASAAVSVIVPLVAYNNHHHHRAACSVDGALDLSNSRSDSEAEPIEEEVDEEDGCVDEGIDSDSDEEEEQEHHRLRLLACAWKQRGDLRHRAEDLRRHGDRYDGSEGENGGSNQIPMQLTTTS